MTMQIIRHKHPGKILMQEYFIPRNLTIYRAAKETGIDKVAIASILCCRKELQVDEALIIARYFGEKDDYFVNLQLQYVMHRLQNECISSGQHALLPPITNIEAEQ